MVASPQTENGYTKIANELMDALAKIRIPGQAAQVLRAIIRKTYGWGKKSDIIPLGQLHKMTGLPKPHVCRALNLLEDMQVITRKDNPKGTKYAVQKDYTLWKVLPKKITVTKKDNESLPKKGHSKENTKETLKEVTTVETNEFFTVETNAHERYQRNYLISDEELRGEYRRMVEWLIANPTRRKKNYARFITNWLHKEYRQRKAVHDAKMVVKAAAAKARVEPKAAPAKKVKHPQKTREEQLAELAKWRRENE